MKDSTSSPDFNASNKQTQNLRVSYSTSIEMRFVISLILSVSMYLIASSIASGWVLFLSAAVFASCILSLAIPHLLLRSIDALIHAPAQYVAGEPIQIRSELKSRNFLSKECRWLVLSLVPDQKSLTKEKGRSTAAVLLNDLAPDNKVTLESAPLKRGRHQLPELWVSSSYPLGLAWVTAKFHSLDTIIILPKTQSIEGKFLFRLKSSVYVPGDSQSSNSGFAASASRGVRAYVRGDSRRNIHWNLSARHGRLMVKEREQEGIAAFDIVLDTGASWIDEDQFELAITTAASLLSFGNKTGIHPELFLLRAGFKDGDPLPERIVEFEQQMVQLACLEYKKDKTGNEGDAGGRSGQDARAPGDARTYQNLRNRPRAVVLVCPEVVESESSLNGASAEEASTVESGARSRTSLFTIPISASRSKTTELEQAQLPQARTGAGLTVSCAEDLKLL